MKNIVLSVLVLCSLPLQARAATVRVVAPYLGSLTNEYANETYRLDLRDTAMMQGVYAQWVNTEKFQGNVFLYRAPDVNYSAVNGLHLNFDYYLLPAKAGKWAAGAGLETLDIRMSAGRRLAGLSAFDMDNRVNFYYLRAGRYFNYGLGAVSGSLMPYAGYARETAAGEISLDVAGPVPPRKVDIAESDSHPLAGLNLNASFARFVDVQAKWMGRFKDGRTLNEYSAMLNVYFARHWGLSYRFKYMEYGASSNAYNQAGIVFAF